MRGNGLDLLSLKWASCQNKITLDVMKYVALLGLGFLSGCVWVQTILHSKPNVVVIMVDTLRADRLSPYGHTSDTTPDLSRYAAEGAVFERAYAHSGWTLPSTVSMLTGLYPHEHRVGRAPDSPSEFGSLPDDRDTLAEIFQRADYSTMAVVNNTFLAPDFGLDQGFEQLIIVVQTIKTFVLQRKVRLQHWIGGGIRMVLRCYFGT